MLSTINRRTIGLAIGVFYAAVGALGFVPGAPIGPLGGSQELNLVHRVTGLVATWAVYTQVDPHPAAR